MSNYFVYIVQPIKLITIIVQTGLLVIFMSVNGYANQKVFFLSKTCHGIPIEKKENFSNSISRHFRLEEDNSPYLNIKIDCLTPKGSYYRLKAHLLYKDKYLFDTRELTIDDAFVIVDDQKVGAD